MVNQSLTKNAFSGVSYLQARWGSFRTQCLDASVASPILPSECGAPPRFSSLCVLCAGACPDPSGWQILFRKEAGA